MFSCFDRTVKKCSAVIQGNFLKCFEWAAIPTNVVTRAFYECILINIITTSQNDFLSCFLTREHFTQGFGPLCIEANRTKTASLNCNSTAFKIYLNARSHI